MIKLVVSDVDGTLVKDGTLKINPEYMDVIKKLRKKGVYFAVCSGRQYSSESQLFAPVKDQIFFVSDGGTLIRTSEKILKIHTIHCRTRSGRTWPKWLRQSCRNVIILFGTGQMFCGKFRK